MLWIELPYLTSSTTLWYCQLNAQAIQSLRDSIQRPPSADSKKGNSYTIKFRIPIR